MKYKVSLAPMVDRTDLHFRNFIRMINKDITLYTEMITTPAILNGDLNRILSRGENDNPIVLQIATSNLEEVKKVGKILKDYTYDEININVGCPSDRVSNYKMGAYLMSEPYFVRDVVNILKDETQKRITIKNRIGIDGRGILENDKIINSYEELLNFIDITNSDKYIIHARLAILKGLSPKENRTIPPLDYKMVYNIKKDRPNLEIEINGGIKTTDEIILHSKYVDSVMIGRALYDNPMLANEINFINGRETRKHIDILNDIFHYVKKLEYTGQRPHSLLRHTLGLFYNTPYSKLWKRVSSSTKTTSSEIFDFLNEIRYDINIYTR